ncbi:MAG TPA: alpha/beta fold hydrolase [Thermoleophilaceae bacterium]|nr:alpha/beta fold hydrolase [Thermoleophilaceae bacterium]
MAEQRAPANGIELVYETIGDPTNPALLLIMGLGTQLIHWDTELCERFAERGFHVIRFDNRDCGRSTKIDAPVPNVARAMAGLKIDAPYTLDDMAEDAFGLLDHLGIEASHVAGVSMGGMIAQTMAIRRPERVLSLTSIMSTTGERRAGRPKLRVWGVLLRRAPRDKDAAVEYFVRVFKLIGSKGFSVDEDRIRELAAQAYERGHNPAGTGRQLAAIMASGDRTERLRQLRVPTTVFHGRDDPLVPFRGGRATADAIPGARLIAVPGMGHDLPREVWPRLVDAVAETAARATAAQAA